VLGLAAVHAGAPRAASANCGVGAASARSWPAAWGPVTLRGAGCLPLAPSGHVGAVAQFDPAADLTGSAPQRQRWCADCKRGHPSGARILKPCKISRKGAPAARPSASLRADPCA
jgi:hypothetical protein